MFHNFSKYDCHLFFKTLLSKSKSQKLKVIPKTNEDYISVNFGCIRFIDSYRFLQSSLDSLVKSLQADLVLLNKEFPENIDLLNKKLAYPYDISILLKIMMFHLIAYQGRVTIVNLKIVIQRMKKLNAQIK